MVQIIPIKKTALSWSDRCLMIFMRDCEIPSDEVASNNRFWVDFSDDFWARKSEIVDIPMEMNSSKRLLVFERTSSSLWAMSRSVTFILSSSSALLLPNNSSLFLTFSYQKSFFKIYIKILVTFSLISCFN